MASAQLNQRVYAIHLESSNPQLVSKIQKDFPANYKLNDSLILVRTDLTSGTIAEKLGFRKESAAIGGAVFKMNRSYSGFYDRDLWDWLDEG